MRKDIFVLVFYNEHGRKQLIVHDNTQELSGELRPLRTKIAKEVLDVKCLEKWLYVLERSTDMEDLGLLKVISR